MIIFFDGPFECASDSKFLLLGQMLNHFHVKFCNFVQCYAFVWTDFTKMEGVRSGTPNTVRHHGEEKEEVMHL
jgi:hypothetical protein